MYRITTLFSGPQVTGGGINHLYFQEGVGTAAQAHSAVATFWGALDDNMQTGNNVTISGEIELVDAATGQITGIATTDQVSLNTASGGEPLPNAVQGLIRLRTGAFVNGREVRGRIFVPFMQEAQNVAGKPSSGIISAWNTAVGALIGNANVDLQVYSRTHHVQHDVTAGQAWSEWAQLRSRRD